MSLCSTHATDFTFNHTPAETLKEVSPESKRDPAGILHQVPTQLSRLCVNHPRGVAAIQGWTGRKRSSMPRFLTPTQRHNGL
ncbi:hypothetical protein FQN60_013053 [Etheostoma spectabile]|uniref:Uncharacterized protein n=1 Tax=Etheostoma spectabile TaxID=54343 RepID=A0A5J5D4R8_9PERO|nr:hypothetical protein FQN60_013053 [Etheostoma spectabile]